MSPCHRRAIWLFFALLFVVFTSVFPYLAAVHNPNENVRVYTTMAIVDDGTFALDAVVRRFGWVEDMAVVHGRDGVPHHYSVKGPALAYAGVPVYWAFSRLAPHLGHARPTPESSVAEKAWWLRASTLVLRLFIVQLPCFAFLVWFERCLRGMTTLRGTSDTVLRLATVAAVGVGSNFLAYALMFASHSLFGVATFACFAVITRERLRVADPALRRTSSAFVAGFLSRLISLLEYQAFLVSLGLTIYALPTFRHPRRLVSFIAGAAVNAAALMFYQWRCFGGPLTTGHTMAESEAFAQMHSEGFYGIVLRGDRVGQIADVLRQLTLSHAFGFFGTSPFMWLGLLALPVALVLRGGRVRARREMIIAHASWLAVMLALFVAISAALNWRGGWVVGPRFFGCAPPLFGFGALCALEGVARRGPAWRTIARAAAAGLAAASALTIGFVSLHFNSVPEEVTRPLAQLSLPLARAGFVPHHIGEVFGVTSPTVWYVVCGCMLALPLVPGLLASGSRPRAYVARLALAALVFLVGIRPAFTEPDSDEGGDGGVGARCFLAQNWEPVPRAARPSGCP